MMSYQGIKDLASNCYNLVKTLYNLKKQQEALDLQEKIADLRGHILDMIEEAQSKDATIAARDGRIKELEDLLKFKGTLIHVGDYYYEIDAAGAATGKGFCANCWETKRVAVRIHQMAGDRAKSQCPNCRATTHWVPRK